ncbi:HNH endonuclease signature motif containing protein [Mycoplasma nasistruthionis]|uniref:HNH endonuclease n=1 Tax=Mycoplasma nasistruthionis TaxID=353852 RepID=A0A5B7XVN4_9MOLU|nr:HNH endonuclease signature motif containing protein [Mycoplasma nasistruthionis]QCZ36505.1 HNH endonuclease [Mycoplasma nasistruthionis]
MIKNKIDVSKAFIENILNANDVDNNIKNNDEIFKIIYETLVFDEYLVNVKFEECSFTVNPNLKYQGVIVNNSFLVYFSQILSSDFKTKSRNTFLAQNFYNAFKIAKNKNIQVCVSLNPVSLRLLNKFNLKFTKATPSINNSIAIMKEIGIRFSNSLNSNNTIENLETFIAIKNNLKLKNSKNDSMFIVKTDENNVDIFGTIDGAKWGETFLTCLLLSEKRKAWNIDKINFILYKNNNNRKLSNDKLNILKSFNINIENTYILNSFYKDALKQQNPKPIDEISLKRNQTLFKRKIQQAFNFIKECFACDYSIFDNLIASHIHRFTDIEDEFKKGYISLEEATKNVTDGVNGFLLCPNHDKEFEKGYIYFDIDTLSFKVKKNHKNLLNQSLKLTQFLSSRITKNKIEMLNEQEMDKFRYYVSKHVKRISE